MNDEENKLPAIGEGEQVPTFLAGDKWYGVDVGPYRLDFSKAYQAPKYTLSWNGIGFAPLGGIHAGIAVQLFVEAGVVRGVVKCRLEL